MEAPFGLGWVPVGSRLSWLGPGPFKIVRPERVLLEFKSKCWKSNCAPPIVNFDYFLLKKKEGSLREPRVLFWHFDDQSRFGLVFLLTEAHLFAVVGRSPAGCPRPPATAGDHGGYDDQVEVATVAAATPGRFPRSSRLLLRHLSSAAPRVPSPLAEATPAALPLPPPPRGRNAKGESEE